MAEKEMTALEFLKVFGQMCNGPCECCPLSHSNNGHGCSCNGEMRDHPKEALQIVQKWAEEHPEHTVRTRLDVFREMFPNAEYALCGGYPLQSCPHFYDAGFNEGCADDIPCEDCKARFWNAPIKEENDAGAV